MFARVAHLTARRQQQLAVRAGAGDRVARDRLASSFSALARQLARQRARRDLLLSREDLEQDAHEALLRALERFDPQRGVPVGAWVAQQIRYALADRAAAMRPAGGVPVRLPRHVPPAHTVAFTRAPAHEADTVACPSSDPHRQLVVAQQRTVLLSAAGDLPRRQRQALVAALLFDSERAAAGTLGVTVPALRSARQRALAALSVDPRVRKLAGSPPASAPAQLTRH